MTVPSQNGKEGQALTVQDAPNVLLTLKDRDFITAQLTDSCLTASVSDVQRLTRSPCRVLLLRQ